MPCIGHSSITLYQMNKRMNTCTHDVALHGRSVPKKSQATSVALPIVNSMEAWTEFYLTCYI